MGGGVSPSLKDGRAIHESSKLEEIFPKIECSCELLPLNHGCDGIFASILDLVSQSAGMAWKLQLCLCITFLAYL